MTPERFGCHRNPVLSGQLGRSLGGGGGTHGLGKGRVLLEQFLELVEGCSRKIFGFRGRQIAGRLGAPSQTVASLETTTETGFSCIPRKCPAWSSAQRGAWLGMGSVLIHGRQLLIDLG
jgi:hypothetical protein